MLLNFEDDVVFEFGFDNMYGAMFVFEFKWLFVELFVQLFITFPVVPALLFIFWAGLRFELG